MAYNYGTPAGKYYSDGSTAVLAASVPKTRRPAYIEELEKRDARKASLIECQTARKVWKFELRMRVRTFALIFGMVILLAGLALIPIIREAAILESNYVNVRLENEIKALRNDNTILEGKILTGADLDTIRRTAVETLGMQEPSHQQFLMLSGSVAGERVRYTAALDQMPALTVENYVKGLR
jgi:hypothetical protein